LKQTIVISAINIFEGGALSILKDCLNYLDENMSENYIIVSFVHNTSLLNVKNITLIEVTKSRRSYIYRLYYEYIWFYFQSRKLKPYLWLSLHDITPNVKANIRSVYCHNPSPFYKISIKEFFLEPSFIFFNLFYKFLYKINLNKNRYVVVQQNWLRDIFINILNSRAEIIVAPPNITIFENQNVCKKETSKKTIFFFPSLPRVFKNFECVCEATKLLREENLDFEMHITISGNENKYAKQLFKKYCGVSKIKFLGLLSREEVFTIYQQCDAIIFPSKLETFGLPIAEAKAFNKSILLANLPYAHETIGNYSNVSFFDPKNSKQLAKLMKTIINNEIVFDGNNLNPIPNPLANNWAEVFNLLLK
jgi:glycosyltransferase involved in cell wall biosynthesis